MTYADTYNIRSTAVNANLIANALDGLLAIFSSDAFPNSNTTSASYVDISGASLSITTAAGELLLLAARIHLSHGTAGVLSNVVFDVDGVDQGEIYWTSHAVDTGGDEHTKILFHAYLAPSVGAHTIKLQWKTASGTLYTLGGEFYAIALQNT